MAVRKIAISVPENVLRQVDRLARKTGTTRSGFITSVLSELSHANNQAEITERLNLLFEEPKTATEQRSTANLFLRAAECGNEDPEW